MSHPKAKRPTTLSKSSKGLLGFMTWLVMGVLTLFTLLLYWPSTNNDFVNCDDPAYILSNPHVIGGLTFENVTWAASTGYNHNWHPLTWLSHMTDCQLFGLNPSAHHLTSILLHLLNTVLVFVLLHLLTGSVWRSFMVAALFGWHPLHVESVAWVSERKDVLSCCFGLLSLIFYVHFARSKIGNLKSETRNYLLALGCFALGLMSKPMLVTWPFVLLLLDYWPLKRISDLKPLLLEKTPFFSLSAIVSIVTYHVQKQGGSLGMAENLPLAARAGNAIVSYYRYLGKLFWPADLAIFYPHPGHWPMADVVLAATLILSITVFVFVQRCKFPFLLMGWLWFLGTLVPVIGLVQVGNQAMADRYTYIPSLGIFILIIWGGFEVTKPWPKPKLARWGTGLVALSLCVVFTREQLGFWRNGEILFRHTLAVTRNNYFAQSGLGVALYHQGKIDEAILHYQESLKLRPTDVDSLSNLATALADCGRNNEAIAAYQAALKIQPADPALHNNLGTALAQSRQPDAAISEYQEAIRLQPNFASAHKNLANTLLNLSRIDEAIEHFKEAAHNQPSDPETLNNLGVALFKHGQIDEALIQYKKSIELKPNYADARNNLAAALFNLGRTDEAIAQFREVVRLEPSDNIARENLARALQLQGKTAILPPIPQKH